MPIHMLNMRNRRHPSRSWKVDGIDVRQVLALIIPIGLGVGWGLAKNPDTVDAAVQVVRGGTAASSAPAASASDIVGVASVTDGDPIEIRGQRIRLDGIDAPEGRQLCTNAGQRYHCGQVAARYCPTGSAPSRCAALATGPISMAADLRSATWAMKTSIVDRRGIRPPLSG